MLKNDPPKQTLLRFLKSVEQAKRGEQATLIGPVKTEDVKKLVETVMSDSWSFPDSRT